MPRVRRRRIKREVDQLLAGTRISAPPVDVDAVAAWKGAVVRKAPLEQELSGLLHRRGEQMVIGINTRHVPRRQRFTLAHEIGHWLLGHGDTVVDKNPGVLRRDTVSSSAVDSDEIEANAFAAELLMPEEWIRSDAGQTVLGPMDEDLVNELADKYDVSTQAMTFRLVNLGLMKT